MPPIDILPEVIRAIVVYMNITNAAILYDDSFVVDHKYKALLQNIPTRHVITAIAKLSDQPEQIEKLRNLDINNFFVLGTLQSIKNVLGECCLMAILYLFDLNFDCVLTTLCLFDLWCVVCCIILVTHE